MYRERIRYREEDIDGRADNGQPGQGSGRSHRLGFIRWKEIGLSTARMIDQVPAE